MKGDFNTWFAYLSEAYIIQARFNKTEEWISWASLLYSMGISLLDQQSFSKAIDLFDRSLKTKEKILGTSHPEVILIRQSLAEAYTLWGKPDRAIDILLESNQHISEFEDEKNRFSKK